MFRWAVGILCIAVPVSAQRQPMVPPYLLSAAERPPLEVTFLLANAGIPCGIEIRESDDVVPRPPADARRDLLQQVPASMVVEAFNASHREYRAALVDGVFVIQPSAGRASFLDSPSVIVPRITIVGTMEALRRILSPLDTRLLSPHIGGGIGPEAAKGLTARFVLDGSGPRRVIDTLNQLVLQMPGAWEVTTRQYGQEWKIAKFGFIYGDRSRSQETIPTR